MDLEQELWRLRSVEYDLDQARGHITELESIRELSTRATAEALKQKDVAHKLLEQEKEACARASKQRNELAEQVATLKQENERLRQGLERYRRIEYMQDTYGIQVVDQVPTQAARAIRKGWRLNR